MSDKQKVIEDTKQLISSILTSEKYGLPLKKLEREFEGFVGYPIPYNKMGFNSARDFFHEINDVVEVTHTPDGGIHLDVITNEKIARVRKLVERQKDPVRKTGSGGWRRGRGGCRAGPRHYAVQRQSQPYGRMGQRSQSHQTRYRHSDNKAPSHYDDQVRGNQSKFDSGFGSGTQAAAHNRNFRSEPLEQCRQDTTSQQQSRKQPPETDWFDLEDVDPPRFQRNQHDYAFDKDASHMPSVPATFRGRILDLLISYPNGLLASNFESVYERRYQERLSAVNMGFATVMDMLRSLSDIIDLEKMANGAVKIHQKRLNRISGMSYSSVEKITFDNLVI